MKTEDFIKAIEAHPGLEAWHNLLSGVITVEYAATTILKVGSRTKYMAEVAFYKSPEFVDADLMAHLMTLVDKYISTDPAGRGNEKIFALGFNNSSHFPNTITELLTRSKDGAFYGVSGVRSDTGAFHPSDETIPLSIVNKTEECLSYNWHSYFTESQLENIPEYAKHLKKMEIVS